MSSTTFSYRHFRRVLKRLDFELIRQGKHETWRKIEADGTIRRVTLSHKSGEDIGRRLFGAMCRQAGITPDEFARLLDES